MCSSAFIEARVRPDSSIEMYAFVYCGSASCACVNPFAVRRERIRAPTSATMGDRTAAIGADSTAFRVQARSVTRSVTSRS